MIASLHGNEDSCCGLCDCVTEYGGHSTAGLNPVSTPVEWPSSVKFYVVLRPISR